MKLVRQMLIAALVVGIGVFASVAIAGNTEVTIKSHDSQGFLDGKVRSSKAGCKSGRLVKLFWDEPGPPREFQKVADDESNGDGEWRINAPGPEVPPGRYYAKVGKVGNCDQARSETIRVPAP